MGYGHMRGRHGNAMQGGHGGGIPELQSQISELQASQSTLDVYGLTSQLPDPSALPDGTAAAVMDASANGEATIYLVREGEWVKPLEALAPSIAFVTVVGPGAGELPEDVVVGVGASVPLGIGWVIDSQLSGARPSGVAVEPLDPDALEIGANGTGLWRVAVQVDYDSPSEATAVQTWFVLQVDSGSGFVDVNYGNLITLAQDPPNLVESLSQVGFALNLPLSAGDKMRVVCRHDAGNSRTYTINNFSVAMNQLTAPPT